MTKLVSRINEIILETTYSELVCRMQIRLKGTYKELREVTNKSRQIKKEGQLKNKYEKSFFILVISLHRYYLF